MKIDLLNKLRRIHATCNIRRVTIGGMVDVINGLHNRYDTIGQLLWHESRNRSDAAELCAELDIKGWPECGCTGCGCTEHATTTDDGGCAVCGRCADYTTDADGSVICSRDERVEMVVESCGAGNQQRTYARLKPPQTPESDPVGEYCLYWETGGNDAHEVERYTTQDEAEQAVLAKDFPRPGDNTNYLCSYSVRKLVDGEWMPLGAE